MVDAFPPTPSTPEERRYNAPLERAFYNVRHPIDRFVHFKAAGGVVLLIATLLALIAVNSPLAPYYYNFIDHEIALHVGEWRLSEPLQLWVSDGLMAIFFLAVGIEIKREVMVGELSTPRKAALPILAAIGGVVVPAVIYTLLNFGTDMMRGWGTPVATDIAFSIGVLALLGERVPRSFYMFLITLAIVDDLIAVVIIAVFYTDTIVIAYIGKAAIVFAALLLLNLAGVRRLFPYLLLGCFLWFAMLKSGIHATMAGVLVAITIPAYPKVNPRWFSERIHHVTDKAVRLTDQYEEGKGKASEMTGDFERQSILHYLKNWIYLLEVPLHRLQEYLRAPVAFVIMPIFAFVNAGVPLKFEHFFAHFDKPVPLGVALGLSLGKPIGISLTCWLALKYGIARLPQGVTLLHLVGAGITAGMGFTMSIFIAGLAFRNMPEVLELAKTGIFLGSFVAGVSGYLFLRWAFSKKTPEVADTVE